jgi:hypothetical protein
MEELPFVEGDGAWDEHRRQFRNHVVKGDDPTECYKWSTMAATMFADYNPRTKAAQEFLKGAGIPLPYKSYDKWNLILQRFHFYQFEKDNPDFDISEIETIVEFGPGYGAMAVVLSELGFRGRYYLYDFAELNLIQKFYLKHVGVECSTRKGRVKKPDLFISCYGLSETDLDFRKNFMSGFKPAHFLIVAQSYWEDIDNAKYFCEWAEKLEKAGGPNWKQEGIYFTSCQD